MLLLSMVESIVGGPATAWPRVNLDFLFARPTDRSLIASTTLAAFFFGNNVPCALALPLLELCMDLHNSDPNYKLCTTSKMRGRTPPPPPACVPSTTCSSRTTDGSTHRTGRTRLSTPPKVPRGPFYWGSRGVPTTSQCGRDCSTPGS